MYSSLLLGVALFPLALAFSTGSPNCTIESMSAMCDTPKRNPNVTFSLDVAPLRQFVNESGPDMFRVSIVASEPGYVFKGFLLFAEDAKKNRVGEWINVAESRAKAMNLTGCSEGNTLTHYDNEPKASGLIFQFRAPVPKSDNDSIKIRCGVVCSVSEW